MPPKPELSIKGVAMMPKIFWRITSSVISLVLLCATSTLGQGGDISGKITKQGQPIEGAKIKGQNFGDESCVKLAKATKLSDDEKKVLDKCPRDVASVVTNKD